MPGESHSQNETQKDDLLQETRCGWNQLSNWCGELCGVRTKFSTRSFCSFIRSLLSNPAIFYETFIWISRARSPQEHYYSLHNSIFTAPLQIVCLYLLNYEAHSSPRHSAPGRSYLADSLSVSERDFHCGRDREDSKLRRKCSLFLGHWDVGRASWVLIWALAQLFGTDNSSCGMRPSEHDMPMCKWTTHQNHCSMHDGQLHLGRKRWWVLLKLNEP